MKYNIKELKTISGEVISIAEAKLYLRIDNDYEKDNLIIIIASVRMAAENYLRASIVKKEFLLIAQKYLKQEFLLPAAPISQINKICLIDGAGREKILPKEYYNLECDRIYFSTNIISPRIYIYYNSGYETVPEDIKQGMLIHMASIFESRLGDISMPSASRGLYQPHRKIMC